MATRTKAQKKGVKAVVLGEAASLLAAEREAAAKEEAKRQAQLSMLPVSERGDRDDLAPEGPARRGRPPGAKNKRTEAWQDYLLGKYRSPLEVLAQTYSRPTAELARELGCTLLEAFKEQIAAAKDLAPFLHQKMPQAIDLKGVPVVPLTINLGVGVAASAAIGQNEENQGVIEIAGRVVGREELDAIEETAAAEGKTASDPLMEDQRLDAPGGGADHVGDVTGKVDDAPPDEDLEEARR